LDTYFMRGDFMKRGIQEGHKSSRNQTVFLKNSPRIIGAYTVVGEKESEGPLGKHFHHIMDDEYFGEKTHEAAEQKMFETAIHGAIRSAGLKPTDIDMMLSGDLLNQITSSSFAARSFDMTFVGLYGACSTMALTLGMGACMVDAGFVNRVVVSAGSHFATAERQYRTPLELGNQKPPAAQWTVTGCGSTVVARGKSEPKITSVTFGKVVDFGINDVNNMGAAMAPAAASTLIAHFRDTNTTPDFYDAIFSGDLGKLGEQILRDLLANAGFPVDERYSDCGRLIYSQNQHAYQGGSGCGCSAVTFNGFILDKFKKGDYKKVLFVATGALLSPVSSFQGNTIPGIAHAIVVES
jgi:stage V sporulation protein AD